MNKRGESIINLRKKGRTYSEISSALKIPKSTVAWWLRGGVKIPEPFKKEMIERSKRKWKRNIDNFNKVHSKIRSKEAAKIREGYKKKAAKEIKKISGRDLKLIGAALYWAEGSNHRNSFRFANSDPMMVRVMMKFLRRICLVPDGKIKARIHLYPQTNENKAINYWKRITGLSKSNFQKSQTQISRASKRKRSINVLPCGTLHLTVHNTEKACQAKGWIRGIYQNI